MRNKMLTGVALGALWMGIILLVVGMWLNVFVVALSGLFIGLFFGLPVVYLLLERDHFIRQQLSKSFTSGKSYLRQKSTAPATPVIEGKLSEGLSVSAQDDAVIQIPVNIKTEAELEPEKFEQVVTQKNPILESTTPAIYVTVDVLAEDDEDVEVVTSELIPEPELPQPSEWEIKKQFDAEYERVKSEIEALEPTAYDELLDYLTHSDARVRLTVVQRLRHIEDERVVNHLQQALNDDDMVVQRAARIALEEAEEHPTTSKNES